MNSQLRESLLEIAPTIGDAAAVYDVAGASTNFHSIVPHDSVGAVTAQQMAWVYKQKMARKTSPGRVVYDALMSAPKYGRCPLCGQRTVSTLDHYLPKASYPSLAVTPTNLVPACADCNKLKLDFIANTAANQTMHPYYDAIDNQRWLGGAIHEASPAALTFTVLEPPAQDPLTTARIRNHFTLFGLAALYASHAAEEIVNIRYQLEMLDAAGGVQAVNDHLTERAISYEANELNAWQSVTFHTLANSEWYCAGGFR